MGNCASTYSLDQCVALIDEPLDADPDIVGPGVMAGFAATALLTFGAIILGYVTKSLPENYLTDLDHKIVGKLATSWTGVTSVKAWKAFVRGSRKCLFLKPPNEKDHLDENQQREALKKFILTLSDQQLVTGIAILVACFANWCRTSVYELNVVVALAWFSSATHLATLDVLQDYFQHNRVVRNWRMIGMVTIVLLLIAGLLLTGFYTNTNEFSAPLPCLTYLSGVYVYDCNGTISGTNSTFLGSATSYDNATFYDNGTYYANGSSYGDCNLYFGNDGFDGGVFVFLGPVFTVAYLVYGYASALLRTFAISEDTVLTPLHVTIYLIFRVLNPRAKQMTMEVINNAIIECRAKRPANINRNFAKLFKTSFGSKLQRFQLIFATYLESFLSHIGGLFFALSYGLSKVATNRWADNGPSLEARSNRVDFGQVVPLVLLVLPLLAAAEIFHENDDKEVEEVSHKQANLAPAANSNAVLHVDGDANEGEQAQVAQIDPLVPETIASTPDASHQPADSSKNLAKTEHGIGAQPSGPFGRIFLGHIIASSAVGILLNLQTAAVLAAAIIMSFLFIFVFSGQGSEVVSAVQLLRSAIRDNTLDKYIINVQTTDNGIEMPAVAHKFTSHETSAVQSSSSADEAPRGRDTALELSVTNAGPGNSREVSQHNEDHDISASPTTIQGHEVEDDAADEDRSYVTPNRQDTESGLRGLHSSTDVRDLQHAQTR